MDRTAENGHTAGSQDDNIHSLESEYGHLPISIQEDLGRNGVCGIWGWYNKKSGETKRFFCGKRTCNRTECKRIFHWRRVRLVSALCEEHRLRYFFTLTVDPKNIARGDDPWLHIHKTWNKFATIIRRKYSKVKYVAILEKHKNNDRPHIHGFWNMFLPWEWVQERWMKCHGGKGYYVEEVKTNKGISDYVGKQLEVYRYVGKDCVVGVPGHVKRTMWRSTKMKASFELTEASEWCIMKDNVFNRDGDQIVEVIPMNGGTNGQEAVE